MSRRRSAATVAQSTSGQRVKQQLQARYSQLVDVWVAMVVQLKRVRLVHFQFYKQRLSM